jgi:hypothetical protein
VPSLPKSAASDAGWRYDDVTELMMDDAVATNRRRA